MLETLERWKPSHEKFWGKKNSREWRVDPHIRLYRHPLDSAKTSRCFLDPLNTTVILTNESFGFPYSSHQAYHTPRSRRCLVNGLDQCGFMPVYSSGLENNTLCSVCWHLKVPVDCSGCRHDITDHPRKLAGRLSGTAGFQDKNTCTQSFSWKNTFWQKKQDKCKNEQEKKEVRNVEKVLRPVHEYVWVLGNVTTARVAGWESFFHLLMQVRFNFWALFFRRWTLIGLYNQCTNFCMGCVVLKTLPLVVGLIAVEIRTAVRSCG